MTIQEAISSGKPFRRRSPGGTKEWYQPGSPLASAGRFTYFDLLARDWETKCDPLIFLCSETDFPTRECVRAFDGMKLKVTVELADD